MLLNSVILILREVMEASILISVLLALSLNLGCGARWLRWSLAAGLAGTVLFAASLELITDALDGAGQEVANATLQGMVYCFIVAIVWLSAACDSSRNSSALTAFMACAVACAMIREGSEILVYIAGFAAVEELRAAVYAGSALGAGIGLSLGVLLFSALQALTPQWARTACLVLLCLIGAGMVLQSTLLLEQVDWIPTGQAIWDSSALVNEESIAGQLLYAVFGYESTPGAVQVVLYVTSLLISAAAYLFACRRRGRAVVD